MSGNFVQMLHIQLLPFDWYYSSCVLYSFLSSELLLVLPCLTCTDLARKLSQFDAYPKTMEVRSFAYSDSHTRL